MDTQDRKNHVIIVGTLANVARPPRRRRGQQDIAQNQAAQVAATFQRRNSTGSRVAVFALNFQSAFSIPCTVQFECGPETPGYPLLQAERVGQQPVAIEGSLRRMVETDRRFTRADADLGARMIETRLVVSQIREPAVDEPLGQSAVWLHGTVQTPPRFDRHRNLNDNSLGRILLQVTVQRPSPFPGSRAVTTEQMEVAVALPDGADGARSLFRAGNEVIVEGQLDLSRIPQATARPIVRDTADLMEQAWQEQKEALHAAIADVNERERQIRRALDQYRNRRQNLLETPLLTVIAGYVELVNGTTLTEEELAAVVQASEERQERRRAQTRQRIANQERRRGRGSAREETNQRSTDAEASPAAPSASETPAAEVIAPAAELPADAAAHGGVVRHRRRMAGVAQEPETVEPIHAPTDAGADMAGT